MVVVRTIYPPYLSQLLDLLKYVFAVDSPVLGRRSTDAKALQVGALVP